MANENQHWVPRFLIAKFADTDGRVFFLDVSTGTLGKRSPRRLASDYDFNNFVINGERVSYEDELEKIETRAAPAFSRIIKQMSTSGLSDAELRSISKFISIQMLRTKSFHVGLKGSGSRADFGSTFSHLWRSALIEARHIRSRPLIALFAPEGHSFYFSDHPVTLQHTESPSSRAPLGLDIDGVEIHMPLTPRISLYWPCARIADRFVSAYSTGEEMHRLIRRSTLSGVSVPGLERVSLLDLQRRMARITPMRNAIVLGSGVNAPQEVVENVNYLQCVWAHGAIFSYTSDFAFARRVFSENPQYRGVPQVGLLQKGVILEKWQRDPGNKP
jgi:hypothetical protein